MHPGYRHVSSPLFFVRPGAAGRLVPSLALRGRAERLGVSPHPRPRVQGVEKNAHELLSNAAPRLRSARAGLTACRIPAEPSPAHLTEYGGPHRIAGPLGPSALGAVVIPFSVSRLITATRTRAGTATDPSHPAPRSTDGSNAPSHRSRTS